MKPSVLMRNSVLRAVIVGISLLFQVGWILLLVLKLNEYYVWISLLTSILSLVAVLRLFSKHTPAAMKIPWIMLILTVPVMGISLYLMTVTSSELGGQKRRLEKIRQQMDPLLTQQPSAMKTEEKRLPEGMSQSRYLAEYARSPVYGNTQVSYYPQAAEAFEELKAALRSAEDFIFLEYFIVSDTSSFREIRQILAEKASQGVEVRLLYDDVGSVGYVNLKFARDLNVQGIQCRVFNPAMPILNFFLNHRDHRKITVVDGKVAFTGGYNLSDEYFDRTRPYGHWKDTGIRLEGEAVASLTASFLEMWGLSTGRTEEYARYLNRGVSVSAPGFVQPFGDDPLGQERFAENVYLDLIYRAKKSLYFMTPYLIITEEMTRALGLAAKRGVDVRILTPGIPDKRLVFAMTRSYYGALASQGVRIFEYTPGFCHGKQCICDGKTVFIGTSNLDYRSLYLHFENDVLFSGCDAVNRVAEDFQDTFAISTEVTEKYSQGRGRVLLTWQYLLRLFAPLV